MVTRERRNGTRSASDTTNLFRPGTRAHTDTHDTVTLQITGEHTKVCVFLGVRGHGVIYKDILSLIILMFRLNKNKKQKLFSGP